MTVVAPAGREVTVYSSAARIAAPTKVDQVNYSCRGIILIIDVTLDPASASLTFTIQGKDPASGKYYTILVSAAITGVGTTILRVDPELTVSANLIAKDLLPATWAVLVTPADGDSMTYSVGAILIP